jgi:serpin B
MRKTMIRTLALPMVVMLALPLAALAREPDPALGAAPGVEALAWGLVRASGVGNAIVSPVSVWETLAMTHAGARGETAAEIARVLGMPDDRAAIAAAAERLREALSHVRSEKISLDIANRLWVQQGKRLEDAFTGLLEEKYGAGAGSVDFGGATEAARKEINGWVSDHTAKKIEELLKPGVLSPLTRLVLTNAVYMKAAWATPFEKAATAPEPFTLAPGKTADVPFMHRSGRMVAGKAGQGPRAVTLCEIPYDAGGQLAMVVIVPDAVDGLAEVLDDLDGRTLWNWQRGGGTLRPRQVNLAVPKWMARKPLSLNEPLASMGMKTAFESGVADFSGVDGTRDLFVSAVVHEGFVDVSEEGTEAAAATGVVIGVRSVLPPQEEPLEVRADRPFTWAVVHQGTGAVLFAGTVTDPR